MNEKQDENAGTSLNTNQKDEETTMTRKFLGNLSDIGSLCIFEDLKDVEHPLLAGKIVKIEPLNYNEEIHGPKVMVVTLKEVFQCEDEKRREFVVFFLNEAAEIMTHSELTIRDCLVIHKPILFRNPTFFRFAKNKFNIALIVGTSAGNRILDIYGRGKNMKNWSPLSEIGTESQRSNFKRKLRSSNDELKKKMVTGTGEATSAIEPVDSDQDDLIPSTPETVSGLRTRTVAERKQPVTLQNDEQGKEKDVTNTGASTSANDAGASTSANDTVDSVQDDIIPDSLDAQANQQKNPEQQLKETGSTSNRTSPNKVEKTRVVGSSLNMKSVSLKDIRGGMNVTVFGVIMNHKELRSNQRQKFLTRIEISDESFKNFPVEFYLGFEEVPLTLRQFDVIKLTNMEIKTYQNQIYGSIKKSSNVVTYSRENPVVRFIQTQSYEYTADDNKRVKKLIRWMQKNIPGAQMFTRLCDIKNICTTVHLLGTVVCKKHFKPYNNFVIRLRDGTQTTQFFHVIDFSKDCYDASRKDIPVEGSDFVDIIVIDAGPTFLDFIENIEDGSLVEMYHVRTSPQCYTYKAQTGCALNLYFKGKEKNLRIRETDSQLESQLPSRTDLTESGKDDQLECLRDTGTTTKKRKLFNADEVITLTDVTNSNICEKKTADVGKSSRTADETNSNSLKNIQTKSKKIKENPVPADEMNSRPRKKVKSKPQVKDKDAEALLSDTSFQLEQPDVRINEESIFCSPCAVLIPRLKKVSETQTVPENPNQKRSENRVSTTYAQTDLEKALMENLYLKTQEIVNVRTDIQNSNMIQNDIQFDSLEEWPNVVQEEFWIKVSLISTLPVITNTSNDMDVLSLISAHCVQCKKYTPFFFVPEWRVTDEGYITLCPSCKVNGREVHLRYLMVADLLVQDRKGTTASAVIAGCAAEKFFDCTIAELITSKEVQLRVRNFLANSKTLILKLKTWKTTGRGRRYLILARR